MIGAIAEPFYGGVPDDLWMPARDRLDSELCRIVEAYRDAYISPNCG